MVEVRLAVCPAPNAGRMDNRLALVLHQKLERTGFIPSGVASAINVVRGGGGVGGGLFVGWLCYVHTCGC